MYFKLSRGRLGAAVVATLVLGAFGGCAKKPTSFEQPLPASDTVGAKENQCLAQAPEVFADYFSGKSVAAGKGAELDARLAEVMDCTSRALDVFVLRIKGAKEGSYTPDELRRFLQAYFLGDIKISDAFLDELMQLKRTFLGGQTDAITVAEIAQARKVVEVFKNEGLRVRPYMPLTPSHFETLDVDAVDAGARAVIDAGARIGSSFEEIGISYSFDQGERFLEQLGKFFEEQKLGTAPNEVRKRIRLVKLLKHTLIAPGKDAIAGNQWKRVFAEGARWHAFWLKHAHFSASYTRWQSGPGRERLIEVMKDLRVLLSRAISVRPEQTIPVSELEELLDAFEPSELPASRDTIRELVPHLMKWLSVETGTGSAGQASIGSAAVNKTLDAVEDYYTGRLRSTGGLLGELLELKGALLGGDPDLVTVDEVAKLRRLMSLVHDYEARLSQYLPLSADSAANLSGDEIDRAATILQEAGEAFARELGDSGRQPYSLQRLESLIREYQRIYGQSEWTRLALDYLPVIRALKSILIAKPEDWILPGQWSIAASETSQWLGIWLKYTHLSRNYPSWSRGAGRERFMVLVETVKDRLIEAIGRHPVVSPQGRAVAISFDELDRLVDLLPDTDLPPVSRREVLKNFLRTGICRMFGGGIEIGEETCMRRGLGEDAVRETWRSVQHWGDGQRYLEALFRKASNGAEVEADTTVPIRALKQYSRDQSLLNDLGLSQVGRDAAADLASVIDTQPRVYFSENRVLSFPVPQSRDYARIETRSFYDLSQVAWMRAVAWSLVRHYSHLGKRFRVGGELTPSVNFNQFWKFCEDFWDLASDLRIVQAENKKESYFRKRFRDSNLFTRNADSRNDLLTLSEGVDFLAVMISSKRLAHQIHWGITQLCPSGEANAFNYRPIDAACYRRFVVDGMTDSSNPKFLDGAFGNFPGVTAYFRALKSDAERQDFLAKLEAAAGVELVPAVGSERGPKIDSSGTESIVVTLHYIEALFARFDTDQSGTLELSSSRDEIAEMFRVFEMTVDKFLREKKRKILTHEGLLAAFTYTLDHGAIPGDGEFLWWRYSPGDYHVQADRGRIVLLMSTLAQPPDETQSPLPGASSVPEER